MEEGGLERYVKKALVKGDFLHRGPVEGPEERFVYRRF
jgi:hypothetical protein